MTNKTYAFDWDDNIFHMPTKIKMDQKVGNEWEQIEVEPAEFARIRGDKENYRIRNNDPNQAFDEFVDMGPRGDKAFLEDVKIAISNNEYGPSWEIFKNCLIKGKLFSIVTSRSHEFSSIRKGVEYIIDNLFTLEEKREMYVNCCGFGLNQILLDSFQYHIVKNRTVDYTNFSNDVVISNYLSRCKFYGVGLPFSNSFKEEFQLTEDIAIQDAKKLALNKFISICSDFSNKMLHNFSCGFSDDDKKTINLIKDFFKEKSLEIPNTKLSVFDTSDRKIKGGIKSTFTHTN